MPPTAARAELPARLGRSITVSPSLGRWYFHHEGSSQFTAVSGEAIGFCTATFL